jgi:hypothetical protein
MRLKLRHYLDPDTPVGSAAREPSPETDFDWPGFAGMRSVKLPFKCKTALHDHARMWFASIWIFTLRLPWALGADFFSSPDRRGRRPQYLVVAVGGWIADSAENRFGDDR